MHVCHVQASADQSVAQAAPHHMPVGSLAAAITVPVIGVLAAAAAAAVICHRHKKRRAMQQQKQQEGDEEAKQVSIVRHAW